MEERIQLEEFKGSKPDFLKKKICPLEDLKGSVVSTGYGSQRFVLRREIYFMKMKKQVSRLWEGPAFFAHHAILYTYFIRLSRIAWRLTFSIPVTGKYLLNSGHGHAAGSVGAVSL